MASFSMGAFAALAANETMAKISKSKGAALEVLLKKLAGEMVQMYLQYAASGSGALVIPELRKNPTLGIKHLDD